MAFNQLTLPTSSEVNYQYDVTLEGVDLTLWFTYFTKDIQSWYLSILTLEGDYLVSNQKLVPHVDMLGQYSSPELPEGILILFSKTSDFENPEAITLDNLSTNFDLLFITED